MATVGNCERNIFLLQISGDDSFSLILFFFVLYKKKGSFLEVLVIIHYF